MVVCKAHKAIFWPTPGRETFRTSGLSAAYYMPNRFLHLRNSIAGDTANTNTYWCRWWWDSHERHCNISPDHWGPQKLLTKSLLICHQSEQDARITSYKLQYNKSFPSCQCTAYKCTAYKCNSSYTTPTNGHIQKCFVVGGGVFLMYAHTEMLCLENVTGSSC